MRDRTGRAVNIGTVGLQTYVIEGLEPGNWYFAVMALVANAAESGLSDLVMKTITSRGHGLPLHPRSAAVAERASSPPGGRPFILRHVR